MKVLILSCNTGGGHNAAASALKESLNFYHHEAEVLDLMSLGRKHTSALVGGAYVKLVSVFPAGFGALYQLGELVRKFPWKSPVYYANARLGNVLADYIDQNHFDAVVTTHLYPAETLTWMKQKGRLTIPCPEQHPIADEPDSLRCRCHRLRVHSVLGRDELRLLCGSAQGSDPGVCILRHPGRKTASSRYSGAARICAPCIQRGCAPPSRSSRECSAVSRHERQYGIRQSASART